MNIDNKIVIDGKALRHYWLYILKLEENKYYVGITTMKNPHDRIRQHGGILGARWTRKYKPLKTVEVKDLGNITQARAESFEQRVAERYMKEFGTDNVRGGRITTPDKVYRFRRAFFTKDMLQGLGVGALIIIMSLYILFNG